MNRTEAKAGASKTLPMTAWLDVLRATFPPTGVLLVGAGAGHGPWVQWLQTRSVASDTVPVHLVEGDEKQCRNLKSIGAGCTVWRDVIAPSAGSATFHRATNPAESGLLPPQDLRQLWPHLGNDRAVSIEDALTLDTICAEAGSSINWLILDCLPAGALLRGGEQLIAQLDVILVRVASDLDADLLADQPAVDPLLQAAGLRSVHSQAERHPGLAHVLYVRDVANRLKASEQAREQVRLAQEAWAEEKQALIQAYQAEQQAKQACEHAQRALQKQLQQAQEAWTREKAALTQEHQAEEQAKHASEEAQQALQEQLQQAQEAWAREKSALMRMNEAAGEEAKQASEQAHKVLQEQLRQAQVAWSKEKAALVQARQNACELAEQASQQVKMARDLAEKSTNQLKQAQDAWAKEKAELLQAKPASEALEQRLLQAQSKQLEAWQKTVKDMEKQLGASLTKGLANSVKQIENFISIQNYLGTGEGLSDFHGWPISPDVGLFLIEKIRERRHDLIIEFGSGTSTALFARTLQISRPKASSKQQKVPVKGVKRSAPARSTRQVYAFEHDQLYLHKTQALLEAQGLLAWVALNHAPLVDWTDDSGEYLYYDCEAALAEAAKRLGGQCRRVLVLIDGPPGATCDYARYPAVPQIFKHLAQHEIDVVLDDANRPEEKVVIELWRAYWKNRSIRIVENFVPSEKGLYWARNYENRTE